MSDPDQTAPAECEQGVSESAPEAAERRVLGDHLGTADEAGFTVAADDQGLLSVGGHSAGQAVAGRGRQGATEEERGREEHAADAGRAQEGQG